MENMEKSGHGVIIFYNSLLTTHLSLHLQGKYFFFKNKYQDQIGINLLKLPPFYPIN
jgi:hypothetical protein